MSAPSTSSPVTFSTSGYEDGLGRRMLVFDRENVVMLERLALRPELAAFEQALAARMARLSSLGDERFARVRAVERDSDTGGVIVISEFAAGSRLCDVLEFGGHSRDENAPPSVDVALGFLLELLPALGSLHATGLTHGAVGPGRLILTPLGQIVLMDDLFGGALERLQFTPHRLWREFRIAMPAGAGASRFDIAADIAQATLSAVALVVGRLLHEDEYPDGLSALVMEVVEIAQIRGCAAFATNLQRFLQRTLPLPGQRPYATTDDALVDLQHLVRGEIGIDHSRSAFAEFTAEVTRASDAALFGSPIRTAPGPRQTAAPAVSQPIVRLAASTVPVSVAPQLPVAPVQAAPAAIDAAAAVQAPGRDGNSRLKHSRSPKTKRDKLRSISAPPPAAAAPVPVAPAQPPRADAPAVPVYGETQAVWQAPAIPNVHEEPFRPPNRPTPPLPYQTLPETRRQPAAQVPVAAAAPAAARIVAAVPAVAPQQATRPIGFIRLKTEPPAAYVPVRTERREHHGDRFAAQSHIDRNRDEGTPTFPWKLASAAVLVMVVGVGVGRAYLPDRDTLKTPGGVASSEAPAPAPVPAAPATGSLTVSTQPAGVRVLLDAKPVGETPLTIAVVPRGRHTVTFLTSGGALKRVVRIEPGKTLSLDVPVFSGWVAIYAPIVLEISENGHSVGTTEQGHLMLPPGDHALTLTNRDLEYSALKTVTIEAGEERSITIEPHGALNLNALPWAEVWIDGQKRGETPLANLQVPLGTREIIFRNSQFGERRMTATVKANAPTAVSIDFNKPPQF